MGLKFRGFRAKLFGKTKKDNNNSSVICLGYRLQSDFIQSNEHANGNTPTEPSAIGPTEVVRQRRPTVKPVVQTIFREPETTSNASNASASDRPPEKQIKPDDTPSETPVSAPFERKTSTTENISTLIHMTANHDLEPNVRTSNVSRDENEYSELDFTVHYSRTRKVSVQSVSQSGSYDDENDKDTASVDSDDMYSRQAASIFFMSEEPKSVLKTKRNGNRRDHEMTSQTSA